MLGSVRLTVPSEKISKERNTEAWFDFVQGESSGVARFYERIVLFFFFFFFENLFYFCFIAEHQGEEKVFNYPSKKIWPSRERALTVRLHHRHTNAKFRVVCGEGFLARKRMATRVL